MKMVHLKINKSMIFNMFSNLKNQLKTSHLQRNKISTALPQIKLTLIMI